MTEPWRALTCWWFAVFKTTVWSEDGEASSRLCCMNEPSFSEVVSSEAPGSEEEQAVVSCNRSRMKCCWSR